jgi:non-ribosomal peptide synthetase component E (peptide arylation enzyme)
VRYLQSTVRDFKGERLARYKLPGSVVRTPAIPRTATRKIDKKLLEGGEPR